MLSRGRRSRNKVSVGEPADGSVMLKKITLLQTVLFQKINFKLINFFKLFTNFK